MRTILVLIVLLIYSTVFAQEQKSKKTLQGKRISGQIKVDGRLDELAWQGAAIATDFVQNNPEVGVPANQVSEVKVLYDDEGVYIGASLFDAAPDSILKQLTERDNIDNSDFFGVSFDCYMDGINGVEFIVTAAGVQVDTKFAQNSQDGNWNAVWWSAVQINAEGWTVEMRIPYAALRFPEVPEQRWHVNFQRNVRRNRENSFWNEIDPNIEGNFVQSGILEGIRDIEPPLRLFFYPYVSGYMENDESQGKGWNSVFNGGMDLKLGLSDAYTLDMTLIPDFGQVRSDNQVLNLSPFEVFFDENRQFFTEGTELFNKVGLFYSRRIGGRPIGYFDLFDAYDEDEIVSNPSASQLLNATKISGRGNKGLGVGVLNAVTSETFAKVRNLETGEESAVSTDPLTNYNVFVLDQNLWQNSYVSLVNTSVMRNGSAYDANVTGTEFKLSNKTNSGAISGAAAISQKYFETENDIGHTYRLSADKTGGKFNFGLEHYVESHNYDPNDLGFLFNNNEVSFNGYMGFRQREPKGKFNRSNQFFNVGYSLLQKPSEFQNFWLNFNYFFATRDFHAFGGFMSAEPVLTYDFFEPRVDGRYYLFPRNYNIGTWVSSDYRKRLALDASWNFRYFDDERRQRFNFEIGPRFRVNDRMMLVWTYEKYNFNNDVGWVNTLDDDAIIFGRRNQDIHETLLETNYVFNNLMGLSFRLRHYWTNVRYISYRELAADGSLLNSDYSGLEDDGSSSHDANFNAFNIDMVYRWVFSPGSEMSIVWKNSILGFENEARKDFAGNLQDTFDYDQVNSLSVKMLYFIDYRSLQSKKKEA